MRELSEADGGDAGELTPFAAGGYEIARLAAGGTLAAIEAVLDGSVDNAYALVRPPGHHAEKDRGRGFCMFGNCAIGAAHARQALGLSRVAIVDWDVHHGNGSQWLFYDDPSVLTISLHQDRNFPPDSGFVSENGEGRGRGRERQRAAAARLGHGRLRRAPSSASWRRRCAASSPTC